MLHLHYQDLKLSAEVKYTGLGTGGYWRHCAMGMSYYVIGAERSLATLW